MLLPITVATSSPMIDQTMQPTIEAFEATLRRHDSATMALEEWCHARGFANPAQVTAHGVNASIEVPATPDIRHSLKAGPGDAIAMRQVELRCGDVVLSRAWNWFLPSRLTNEMNEALRLSDTPFGKVVAPLRFARRPLATLRGRAHDCPGGTISTHRAMLVLPDGRPLAYLIECYTAANLTGG